MWWILKMDIKKPKLDMRTAIYLIIILLIIISIVYLVSTGSDDSDEILSVKNLFEDMISQAREVYQKLPK